MTPSWFAGKVSGWVRGGSKNRSADDLAAELEQQARQISDRLDSVTSLLTSWIEQTDCCAESFLVIPDEGHGDEQIISFHEALLRSRAFELLIDACSKSPAISAKLRDVDTLHETPLGRAFSSAAERFLWQDAVPLWPHLLQAFLTSGQRSDSTCASKCSLRWEMWALRLFAAVKRTWQSQAAPNILKNIGSLIQPSEENSIDPRRPATNGSIELHPCISSVRVTKEGIQARFAHDTHQQRANEADSLRSRVELLFDAAKKFKSMESSLAARVPKLERLHADVCDALTSLDIQAGALSAEGEQLSTSVSQLGGDLQKQITSALLREQSILDSRRVLRDEKMSLTKRLREISIQIEELDSAATDSALQVQQLRDHLNTNMELYEKKIEAVISAQRDFSNEKLRAVTYMSCVQMALDAAKCETARCSDENTNAWRTHRSELRQTCADYLQAERLRLDAVGELLRALRQVKDATTDQHTLQALDGNAGHSYTNQIITAARNAWNAVQRCRSQIDASGLNGPDHELGSTQESSSDEGESNSVQAALRAVDFFDQVAARGQQSVDCNAPGTGWASVSFGTFLCTDCAGRHRGLGVHLSFVRSTTMDDWSDEQLRHMKLGGNTAFRNFIEGYPHLCRHWQKPLEVDVVYRSTAAAFYRRRLKAMCGGHDFQESPPSPNEGHTAV